MKKSVKDIVGCNIKSLIGFEVIYKLLSTIIFIPLFLGIFKLIMHLSGYNYLTFENIFSFVLNPLTLLFLLILIIFITFYTLIDISTVIIILDSSYQDIKISIKEAFLMGVKKASKLFKPQNFLISLIIIFLIPFLNIGISSGFVSTVKIPEFIMHSILSNQLSTILYIILLIILTIILFRWLYVIHYFVLEDCSFPLARKKSIKLSHKNKFKDFIMIILTQIVMGISYILFILLGISIITVLYKLFSNYNLFSNLSITVIWLLIMVSFIVMLLLSTPISYGVISVLYYRHKNENKEKIKHIKVEEKLVNNKKFNVFKVIIVVLTIIFGTIFTYGVVNRKYNLNIEYLRVMEVTAHRGASFKYPENTMSAFEGAITLGADWIELDVQETKDGKIIVLHDSNLRRTTGVNKNTLDLTYDEIKDLDAGSFFSSEFKDERIPLLEDVVKLARDNNIKLNIELKPTGKEKDFEKKVVDIINKYDYSEYSVVTSQVYKVLENVKDYDENIKTIYVMSLAFGNIIDLDKADGFSVEASSVTKTLVKDIHNAGKVVFAWTVNTKDSILKMIEMNVDNIITDDITLAKEEIYNSRTSNVIKEFTKKLNELLK